MSDSQRQRSWVGLAERGSVGALRLGALAYRLAGPRLMKILLLPVVGYFFVTVPRVRRASRDYLETLYSLPQGREALGHPPGWRDEWRHLKDFTMSLMDRLTVWAGQFQSVDFDHCGSEHLFRLAREGRGGILVGSHLGSFDLMRLLAGRYDVVVNVLMFTDNAERIQVFFERFDPDSRVRVIQMDPSSMRTAFEIRACLERGEFVGILADRPPPRIGHRSASVPFLGRPAEFSLGPFLLAAVLGAPLLFAVCVSQDDSRYLAVVEPLWEGEGVPRGERDKLARELLSAYVARLETYCIRTPFQWFNFYDFWGPEAGGSP